MKEKDKNEITQYEKLKKTGRLIKKEQEWIWYPRTLSEYKELANVNYNHWYQILTSKGYDKAPKNDFEKQSESLFEISGAILYAFTCAKGLILWSRNTECENVLKIDTSIDKGEAIYVEIHYPWILYCESLSTIILKLHKTYNIVPADFFDAKNKFTLYEEYCWPKNPGVTVFNEPGYSFLDASFMFSAKIWLFTRQAYKTSLKEKGKKVSNIIIEPEICDEVQLWKNELSKMLLEYMPVSEWNNVTIERVEKSLLYKIEDEQEMAHKTQMSNDIKFQQALAVTTTNEKSGEIEVDLDLSNIFKEPIEDLIEKGEGPYIEFKSTLEYDINKNQRNKDLNKECLKAIAAFLNANGGVLLIGVNDDGTILGIEQDLKYVQRRNLDGFKLKIHNLLRDLCKPTQFDKVDVQFEEIVQITICRINLKPASQIVHLDNEVYIRHGNTTIRLSGMELTNWVQQRNKKM